MTGGAASLGKPSLQRIQLLPVALVVSMHIDHRNTWEGPICARHCSITHVNVAGKNHHIWTTCIYGGLYTLQEFLRWLRRITPYLEMQVRENQDAHG